MGKRCEKATDKVVFTNDQEAYEMMLNFISY